MPYHTSMKVGYEFKGTKLIPYGNQHSIDYHSWINLYCKQYKYANLPLDANAIAGIISTEDSSWNPLQVAGDYATTGSVGLGQFITKPYKVAQEFGLNTRAQQEDPRLNIIAICNKISGHLKSANGDYNLAYRMYNAGSGYNGNDAIIHGQAFNKYYTWWARFGDGKISTSPVKTANNQSAVTKAQAQKQADILAQKTLQDKLTQQDAKEELAEKQLIAKAKLTNDANQIAKAQAQANLNAKNRAIAKAKLNAQKIASDKADALKKSLAYKQNNADINTPNAPKDSKLKSLPTSLSDSTKSKVLKSGFSLIGVLAIAVLLGNGYIPKEELE